MKRQIRRGTFETNSSSTHSITMCSGEEYDKWKDGKILFDAWKEEFVDNVNLTDDQKEYARKEYESKKNDFSKDWEDLSDSAKEKCYEKYIKEHNLIDEEYKTYDEYMNDYELESFFDTYTTKNGEKVVAFGKYGYEG